MKLKTPAQAYQAYNHSSHLSILLKVSVYFSQAEMTLDRGIHKKQQ